MDLQNGGTDRRGYEEDDVQVDNRIDSNENSINAHQRAKALKRSKKQNSDLEIDPAQ